MLSIQLPKDFKKNLDKIFFFLVSRKTKLVLTDYSFSQNYFFEVN